MICSHCGRLVIALVVILGTDILDAVSIGLKVDAIPHVVPIPLCGEGSNLLPVLAGGRALNDGVGDAAVGAGRKG